VAGLRESPGRRGGGLGFFLKRRTESSFTSSNRVLAGHQRRGQKHDSQIRGVSTSAIEAAAPLG
jgi:hypothetical protein